MTDTPGRAYAVAAIAVLVIVMVACEAGGESAGRSATVRAQVSTSTSPAAATGPSERAEGTEPAGGQPTLPPGNEPLGSADAPESAWTSPAEAPEGQVLVAEYADEAVRYRMFTAAAEGSTFEVTSVVEHAPKDGSYGGRGRSVGPLNLPLEVNDGLASNAFGRIAKGIAPVDAVRVDLVADDNVVASTRPYQHPDLGASFFLARVAHAAPSLDGAVAYDANGAAIATSGHANTAAQ